MTKGGVIKYCSKHKQLKQIKTHLSLRALAKQSIIFTMKHERQYFIYIMTNKHNRVLYTGVTNCLENRVLSHRRNEFPTSFTARYNCHKLVYWEEFQYIGDAILREKQIKAGSRQKKLDLINVMNPEWKDLAEGWFV